MCKAHWLGIAWQAGNTFTYYIKMDHPQTEGHPIILIQFIIKIWWKNIGQVNECVEENPALSKFFCNWNGVPFSDLGDLGIDTPLAITFDSEKHTIINKPNELALLNKRISEI